MILNDELESVYTEAVVVKCILRDSGKPEAISVRIADLRAEV
jgi:transcription antitermination factor NusA-like protein